ncbi:MAG TPA: hypothetical protein VLL52_03250 [Anaerolineae bacterium]|nr:hypothetical protein [Anaerolineae bacterium]
MRFFRRRGGRRLARRQHPRPRHGLGPGFPAMQQANQLFERGAYDEAGQAFHTLAAKATQRGLMRQAEVEWIDAQSASCAYCASTLKTE